MDESITITDEESFSTCHALAQTQGILVGGSAGMNVCAAIKIAEAAPEGSVVVTILCDNGVKCVLPPACLPIRPGPAPTSPAHFNPFPPRIVLCSEFLPRGGVLRYLSKVYNNEWLESNKLSPVEDTTVLEELSAKL